MILMKESTMGIRDLQQNIKDIESQRLSDDDPVSDFLLGEGQVLMEAYLTAAKDHGKDSKQAK